MAKKRVIGSYLVQFIKSKQETHIRLQNIRTGEQLSFETWVSAWAFLESVLEEDKRYYPKLGPQN